MSVSEFILSLITQKEKEINQEWTKGVFSPKNAVYLVNLTDLCAKSKEFMGVNEQEKGKEEEEGWDEYEERGLKRILDEVKGKKRVTKRVNYSEDILPDLYVCDSNGIEWFFKNTSFGQRIMGELQPIIDQTGHEVENSSAKDSFMRALLCLNDDEFTIESCRKTQNKCFLCDLKRNCTLKIIFDNDESFFMGSRCGKVIQAIQQLHELLVNHAELGDPEIEIMSAVETIKEAHIAKSKRRKKE